MSAARLSRIERTVEFVFKLSTVAPMPLPSVIELCCRPTTFNVTPAWLFW